LSAKLSEFLFEPNPQQADSTGLDDLVKSTNSLASKITRLQEEPVSASRIFKGVLTSLKQSEKKKIKDQLAAAKQDQPSQHWSSRDLLALMCRVFKLGENEWDIDLINELE
jgi:hypothetical protein